MEKIIAVIQSRFNSTRLPGKAMLPLAEKPLLEHVIDRVQKLKNVDLVIVATGIHESNQPIVDLARSKGCNVYRGPDEDVLKRFYDATNYRSCQYVIRATGDNPFVDVELGNKLIQKELKDKIDYYGMSGIPIGVGIEMFKKSALDRAYSESKRKSDREHVTTYIKLNNHIFHSEFMDMGIVQGEGLRLTVDYKSDYILASKIYEELYHGKPFSIQEVLKFLKKNPELIAGVEIE